MENNDTLEKIEYAEEMSLMYQRDSRRMAGFIDLEKEVFE